MAKKQTVKKPVRTKTPKTIRIMSKEGRYYSYEVCPLTGSGEVQITSFFLGFSPSQLRVCKEEYIELRKAIDTYFDIK